MKHITGTFLLLSLHASVCISCSALTVPQTSVPVTTPNTWQSTKAEHVYGLPDIKKNKKGTLTLDADALTFTGTSGNASIPRLSVTAVSAGNERVEIWGMGGRILRMTIPNGGGIAAAAVMHHRIDMLTIEFKDAHGGGHSAVFFLPANEAEHALRSFALTPLPPSQKLVPACDVSNIQPGSVFVSTPNWDGAQVPAAYRALVYEHLIDRLHSSKEITHVYRDGEGDGHHACPQYTIHIAINAFKEGSSVKRALMGPVGMFVGTTQMKFNVTFTDTTGKLNASEQISTTIRGESESTGVADHVAKDVAKHYAKALKTANKSAASKTPTAPVS
jgi:hypothetical protein